MSKKKLLKPLKTKIYNHLMINGNKKTCEKIFLKSSKLIQKSITKNQKDLIKLALINVSPIVKLKQELKKKTKRKKQNTREFPYIIKKHNRIFLAIKSILKNSSNKEFESSNFYVILKQVIISNSQNKSNLIDSKYNSYESALKKKKYIYIKYRWI